MERGKLRVERLGRESALRFARLLPPGEMARLARRQVTAIGCWYGEAPCGVLVLESRPAAAELHYLYVDGRIRRQGVGRLLLGAAGRACRERGQSTLRAAYLPGDHIGDVPGLFLQRLGFVPEAAPMECYTVPLAALRQSSFMAGYSPAAPAPGVVPLAGLPPWALAVYRSETGRAIPRHTTPARAVGEVLPGCSLAALRGSRVVASTLFTRLQGETVLEAVYARSARHAGTLLSLVRRGIWQLAEETPDGRLRMVAATPDTRRLAARLLEGVPRESEARVSLRAEVHKLAVYRF